MFENQTVELLPARTTMTTRGNRRRVQVNVAVVNQTAIAVGAFATAANFSNVEQTNR